MPSVAEYAAWSGLQPLGPESGAAARDVVLEQSALAVPYTTKPAIVESDIGKTNAWSFTQSAWLTSSRVAWLPCRTSTPPSCARSIFGGW